MCIFEGKEYYSDTARIIKKFDIYTCDLGNQQADDGLLSKSRPCVIVSNDDHICPKSSLYLIAPIRTEHNIDFTRETIEDVVKERRETGRIYIPIEMSPNDFRFIDITQSRIIKSNKIDRYCSSIINEDLKKRINRALVEKYLSIDELTDVFNEKDEYQQEQVSVRDIKCNEEEDDVEDVSYEEETNKLPEEFFNLYEQYKQNLITLSEASNQLQISNDSFINLVTDYESTGVHKENLNMVIKQPKGRGTKFPTGFSLYYKSYKDKKMTVKQISEKSGLTVYQVRYYIKKYESLKADMYQVK